MKIAVWVPLAMDVLSTLTFGRSDAQGLISGAFCVVFVCVSYSLTTFTQLGPPDEPQLHPCRPISATRQTSALQGACRRALSFCQYASLSVVLPVCRFVRKSFRHNLLIGAIRPADHDGTIRNASNRPVRPLQVFLIFTVSKKWSL